MPMFLVLANTYTHFEIALFNNLQIIDRAININAQASKLFIPMIEGVLRQNNFCINDIDFIVVNQGPGPFTTLRTTIATANGLSFATGIPLVGVDGMQTFLQEYKSPLFPYTVALFNAFNKDVYFGIQAPEQPIRTGYKNYELFLAEIVEQFPERTIRFIGSGVSLYQQEIAKTFGTWATIADPLPEAASIEFLGLTGLQRWTSQENISDQLLPLYLKKLSYRKYQKSL